MGREGNFQGMFFLDWNGVKSSNRKSYRDFTLFYVVWFICADLLFISYELPSAR